MSSAPQETEHLSLPSYCLSERFPDPPATRSIETKVSVSSLPASCCIRDYNGLLALSRSLSVSSVSSVSSASSSSSSVRSADSEDMYADLASPVSSASSRSPTPAQQKKGRGTWFGIFFSKDPGKRREEQRSAYSSLGSAVGSREIAEQTLVAGVDQGSPEASPEEGVTMEKGGCGASKHLHPSIPVSQAGKMAFTAC